MRAIALLLCALAVALCDRPARPRVNPKPGRIKMDPETSISVQSSNAGAEAIVRGSGTTPVTINAGSHRTVVKVEPTTITASCGEQGLEVKAEVTQEAVTIDFGHGEEARRGEVKEVSPQDAGKGLTGRFRLKRQ